jgi:hypothetical protein
MLCKERFGTIISAKRESPLNPYSPTFSPTR